MKKERLNAAGIASGAESMSEFLERGTPRRDIRWGEMGLFGMKHYFVRIISPRVYVYVLIGIG